jgi:hypothetical protein
MRRVCCCWPERRRNWGGGDCGFGDGEEESLLGSYGGVDTMGFGERPLSSDRAAVPAPVARAGGPPGKRKSKRTPRQGEVSQGSLQAPASAHILRVDPFPDLSRWPGAE